MSLMIRPGNLARAAMAAVISLGFAGCNSGDDTVAPILTGTVAGTPLAYQQVAVAPDSDYILVGDGTTNIVRLAARDGAILWEYALPSGDAMESGAIAADASIVIIGTEGGKVVALSGSGQFLWEKDRPGEEVQVAVTDNGSMVFAGGGMGGLSCYSGAGIELWSRKVYTRGWGIWGIACSSTGDTIMLKTNSDIILCNGLGVEVSFFDIVDGNKIWSADLIADGTFFAVLFADGATYQVALYHVVEGEFWRQTLDNGGAVSVTASGDVFATVRNGENIVFNGNGEVVLTWLGGGNSISVDDDGLVCAVGTMGKADIYEIQ
ncbi:MAG: PQQ-binding-like beta-propeller repeat protein [bacterium]